VYDFGIFRHKNSISCRRRRGARLAKGAAMARSFSLAHLALALAGLALPACGGKATASNNGDPSGGGSSGGSANLGGSGNLGGSSSGGGAGGAPQCDRFIDDKGWSVAVLILNETSAPLYLGPRMANCGSPPPFQVLDATRALLPDGQTCGSSCEDAMNGSFGACPIACAIPTAITLQPGESLSTLWRGLAIVKESLPEQCRSSNGPAQCDTARNVAPGTFTFTSQAGTALDCSKFGARMCGPCVPNGNGGCSTPGAIVSGALSAEVIVELDGSYGVGGGGGAGITRSVEVVFKN
jgi:hypothetical protein